MESKSELLVKEWFAKWKKGDFLDLPITENFKHTSPFGTIEGKESYLRLVNENKEKFLGYRFEIRDEIYEDKKACIRYRAIQGDHMLDVSEWHYIEGNLIAEVIAYYHIGEIRAERELNYND